jgi:hypothetical protein
VDSLHGWKLVTWLLVEDDVDVLHVEIELEMTWKACIKKLEVSGMTWLLVKDDVDVLHVEIEYVVGISFIRDIDRYTRQSETFLTDI